jgi:hypothetical protein
VVPEKAGISRTSPKEGLCSLEQWEDNQFVNVYRKAAGEE